MKGGVTDAGQTTTNQTNSEDRATQPNGSWRLSFAIKKVIKVGKHH